MLNQHFPVHRRGLIRCAVAALALLAAPMSLHALDDPVPYCNGRGSQALLDTAKTSAWTVISMKDDWKTTFAGDAGTSRR